MWKCNSSTVSVHSVLGRAQFCMSYDGKNKRCHRVHNTRLAYIRSQCGILKSWSRQRNRAAFTANRQQALSSDICQGHTTLDRHEFRQVRTANAHTAMYRTSKAAMQFLRLSSQKKDLYLARISQALLVVGWSLLGLSPSIATVAISTSNASLGQGSYLLLRSFITSLALPTT
ncbi:hypothetical protein EJ03DRAFT_134701 [Teratosphaeria nubilosa]|uniref:Uncharacterized protein n=1 Tax=Teratosphaeria nubilosa TaxID=161662 RepID=A0A6G1L5J5_9PEZI|nr:hypothetical protein EJ03DRAFT_134701 [Teratosphaeria nubilosa]